MQDGDVRLLLVKGTHIAKNCGRTAVNDGGVLSRADGGKVKDVVEKVCDRANDCRE